MIDVILAFVATWFLTWPALALFCVFGVLSEHNESRGFAVFWTLVAAVTAFFYFGVSLIDIAIYGVAYLVIGVLWSFYRYKRYVEKKVDQLKEIGSYSDLVVQRLHPSKMLDTITAWIVIWPISFVDNLCGDIINGIETLVKKVFKGVYHRIYVKAVNGLIPNGE